MNGQSGTHADMFSKYFPGEPWTIVFEPTPEQSSSMIRLAGKYAGSNTESDALLMMLGVIPSESAFNPTARDAWTKKTVRVSDKPTIAVASDGSMECKNGHIRSQYSFLDPRGHVRCRKCHAVSTAESRARRKAA